MLLDWNDEKFSLNISAIDTQHKELIHITNQLHEILGQENYQGKAIKILKRLYAYTSYHFTSEEAMLKENNYPQYRAHIQIHKTFKTKIKESLEGVRDKRNYPLAPLQDFLVEWILNHILGEDVKYAAYFKEKGITPDPHFSISQIERSEVLDQWHKQKLELEIKGLDNQHRELIMILQQTNDLQHTSDERKKLFIPEIIKKLFYYSQFHFSYEEEHMAKNNYPLLKEQQEQHIIFINHIRQFVADYNKGIAVLTDEIVLFLKDWTINHILQDDKKYKDYLLENKLN